MEICKKCIMPQKSPVVFIDKSGICNYCKNYYPVTLKGEQALIKNLQNVKSKNDKYDCMVNISGGRDSSYTLLTLVKDYSMKVLAVNYSNPFTDEQAKKNIENMIKLLNVDFIQFNLKNNIHERILRNNILAWFKNPSAAMVPAICIGCKIIWPSILKSAHENSIKCIINGGNPYEYTLFKKQLLGVSLDANLKRTYFTNMFGLLRESLRNLNYLNPKYLPITIKGYLFSNQYAIGSRLLGKKINSFDLFHYIPWDEHQVISRIKNELNWDYPKNLNSSWRFDCKISHLKDFMYLKTLGITERDDFYSKLIRENKLTRFDALSRIKRENTIYFDQIYELFSKLGIKSIDLKKEIKKSFYF